MTLNRLTMVETGGSIFIVLAVVAMLLALLPACLLYIRKAADAATLNALKILCLLVTCQYGTFLFTQPAPPVLQAAFKLVQFTVTYYLFTVLLHSAGVRNLLKMVLVSFLSVTFTMYALKSVTAYAALLTLVQSAVLTVLAVAVLIQLINNRLIILAGEPAFWIAGGLLCYNGMQVLMEAMAGSNNNLSQQIQQEKALIITTADILRMIFFIVAASVAGKKDDHNHHDPIPPSSLPPFLTSQGNRHPIKY